MSADRFDNVSPRNTDYNPGWRAQDGNYATTHWRGTRGSSSWRLHRLCTLYGNTSTDANLTASGHNNAGNTKKVA
jgi:hypothetical protein